MSKHKNHSEQFERYLKGQMRPEEANAYEQAILNDPFSEEALEGFEETGIDAFADIEKLKGRISKKNKKDFSWLRIAAVIALLMASSLAIYFATDQIETGGELAMEKEDIPTRTEPSPDTIALTSEDTSSPEPMEEVTETTIETVERDGLKFTQNDQELVESLPEETEVFMVENQSKELTLANVSEDIVTLDFDRAIEEDSTPDVSNAMQGKAAGVSVARAGVFPLQIDSGALIETEITVQSLVARNEGENRSFSTDENEEKAKKTNPKSDVSRAISRSIDATVSGTVTDGYGEALPGVNVVIKGTSTGVTTDIDGHYELPKFNDMTLVYSYVGFETQEMEIGSRSVLDVTLGGATELQEVVVTGYGANDASTPSYKASAPDGGNKAYKTYLEQSLKYPDSAIQNEIEGIVVLELTIDPSGQIANIDIKKSLGYGCDEEAIRLVREGSSWSAAEKDGVNVEDKVKVKVRFKL